MQHHLLHAKPSQASLLLLPLPRGASCDLSLRGAGLLPPRVDTTVDVAAADSLTASSCRVASPGTAGGWPGEEAGLAGALRLGWEGPRHKPTRTPRRTPLVPREHPAFCSAALVPSLSVSQQKQTHSSQYCKRKPWRDEMSKQASGVHTVEYSAVQCSSIKRERSMERSGRGHGILAWHAAGTV